MASTTDLHGATIGQRASIADVVRSYGQALRPAHEATIGRRASIADVVRSYGQALRPAHGATTPTHMKQP
ncbi:MAG: hypothetical protein IPN76_16750 [Saprospiraceae bacterium]|nr:hypothetical protein [Saprospiraceae bacterium]